MPTENRSSNISASRDLLERLQLVASGQLSHMNAGSCPDHVEGHAKRDEDCSACRALSELDRLLAQPAATVVVIPDGYCLMPRKLPAENGAKAMLLGEFKLEVTRECPECLELEEPLEGCEICDGEGEYGQSHIIPWEKIKFIYSEAVKGLALHSNTAR